MFTIAPDKVCRIIATARALDARLGLGDPAEAAGAGHDGLDEAPDAATPEELAALIAGLDQDDVSRPQVGRGPCFDPAGIPARCCPGHRKSGIRLLVLF